MQQISDIPADRIRPSVATIGFFDGVHRGHRYLLSQVQAAAAQRGLASTVITFPVHPRSVMQPDFRAELLTTCTEKLALLDGLGLDYCLLLDFTPALAALSARQFMELLAGRYNIRVLFIGYDHRFGHDRREGFDDYVRYGRELGIEILPGEAYLPSSLGISGEAGEDLRIGSSSIRRLLHEGDVARAADYLGYRYFLNGTVGSGFQVGHKLGYPTANLEVDDPCKLIPARGVYAVEVLVDGHSYGGMLNIGCRPTLDNGTNRTIEVHIFDFDADIYHHPLRLTFVQRIRPERKFDSLDELAAQLHRDAAEARTLLSLFR